MRDECYSSVDKLRNTIVIFVKLFAYLLTIIFVSSLCFIVPKIISDRNDLLFVTQANSRREVIEYFGREPIMIYKKGDVMPRMGWKVPSRPISNEVLIYDKISSLRFYIYIDNDGKVEYVFTSTS